MKTSWEIKQKAEEYEKKGYPIRTMLCYSKIGDFHSALRIAEEHNIERKKESYREIIKILDLR